MLLIPFGFTASSGGPLPTNTVAPLLAIVDAETREISYTAGTWEDADTVSFAWFMNNVEQVGEVGTSFFADFDLDVKVVETATNVDGSVSVDSNIVNIPSPPQFDATSVNWSIGGSMADPVFADPDLPASDSASVNWSVEGDQRDSFGTYDTDAASVYWDVFGSYV